MSALKLIGKILLSLVVVGLSVILILWFNPQLLVNEKMVQKVLRSSHIPVGWKALKLEAKREGWNRLHLLVNAQDFAYKSETTNVDLEEVSFTLEVYFPLRPRLVVQQLDCKGRRLDLKLVSSGDGMSGSASIKKILDRLTVENSFIHFPNITIESNGARILSKATFKHSGSDKESKSEVLLGGTAFQEEGRIPFSVRANLDSLHSHWFGPYSGIIEGNAKLDAHVIEITIRFKNHQAETEWLLTATRNDKQSRLRVNSKGSFGGENAKGSFDINFSTPQTKLTRLSAKSCELDARHTANLASASLHCPIKMVFSYPSDYALEFPLNISGELREGKSLQIKSELRLPANSKLTVNAEGIKERNAWEITGKSNLDIKNFHAIVQALFVTPFAVPAPFNVLNGVIKAETDFKFAGKAVSGKTNLRTNLKSSGQDLVTTTTVLLNNLTPMNLQVKTALEKVALQLPDLNLSSPPRLIRDERIRPLARADQKVTDDKFTVEISAPRPVLLKTTLTEAPVPLTGDLKIDSTQTNGHLRIEQFPLELFRRKATVKVLDLTLAHGKEFIKGNIDVAYVDYTVHMTIIGPLDSPQIFLTSDPAVSQDKVWALLLFGRVPDELDEGEMASVGSARAAVEDSAVSLASLYLLASTPIESIGYNPITEQFTAKIRIADGTSLNVGSDLKELNRVGVRKKLGSHWALATYLEHPFSDTPKTLATLLEWSKSY